MQNHLRISQLYNLFAFNHRFAGLPEEFLSDKKGSIDQQNEAEADLETEPTLEAEDQDTCPSDEDNELAPESEIGEENKAFSSDWSISLNSEEVSVLETSQSAPEPKVVGRENKAFASAWSVNQNNEEAMALEVESAPRSELGKENDTFSSAL